jgi:hypothetical protein
MNPLLLSGLFDIGKGIIDKLFPDPAKAEAAKLELLKMQQNGELAELAANTQLANAQIMVNVEEAKNASLLVSGWRPMVGWIGAFAMGYAAILEPVGRFVAQVFYGYEGPFPALDTTITMQVLFGILGLGGYRTFEKVKGAEGNR